MLIQKPMGPDLADARRILDACAERQLIAAINFQLRFSPGMLALHDLRRPRRRSARSSTSTSALVIEQPWHIWTFLERRAAARGASTTRSITSTRSAGSRASRAASTAARVGHPALAATARHAQLDHPRLRRSAALLAGAEPHAPRRSDAPRLADHGRGHDGAARLTWGVNLDYPAGPPDTMEIARDGGVERRAAARLVVHRGVRRTDVEPAAVRRGEDATLVGAGRRRHQDDGASSRRATSPAPRGGTPIPAACR